MPFQVAAVIEDRHHVHDVDGLCLAPRRQVGRRQRVTGMVGKHPFHSVPTGQNVNAGYAAL
jgi:hypothetical protein